MTNPEIPPGLIPEAVDLRRAAALIKHANPDQMNLDGLAAIIAEVKTDRRITEILVATAVIAHQVPAGVHLGDATGQNALDDLIHRYGAKENHQ